MCTMCMAGAAEVGVYQPPLEFELQMVIKYLTGSKNQTWVPCMVKKYS